MAGLGAVKESKGLYLSLAGGYVWNRKAESNDPNFATQEYTTSEGVKTRQGARYADLTGMVKEVEFRTHDKYGESINVVFDADGEIYIISISTNNRYSQDMMKALLVMDLEKNVFIKPYDFTDKANKRVQGISFRQDGEKLNIRNNDAPNKESEWFGTASKKEMKRFFEDLSDWFVAEVEEKVIPQLGTPEPKAEKAGLGSASADEKEESTDVVGETPAKEKAPAKTKEPIEKKVSPIAMKKALKLYIAENYGEETLPKLSKEDLVTWYNLALQEEELPFQDSTEVAGDDLDSELASLLSK